MTDTDIARFHANVQKGEGCWVWTAATVNKAKLYGVFYAARRNWLAHRVAWLLANGEIPDGLYVCHHCDNPRCVRPDHLFLGTCSDNMRDASGKGRMFGQRPADDTIRGERHGIAKLDEAAVRELRALHASGATVTSLARKFGVSRRAIDFVLSRETWGHVA